MGISYHIPVIFEHKAKDMGISNPIPLIFKHTEHLPIVKKLKQGKNPKVRLDDLKVLSRTTANQ